MMSPRSWGVTGSADWETCEVPAGKRLPRPGELEDIRMRAAKNAGGRGRGAHPTVGDFANALDKQPYLRRVHKELYRLIAETNIFIEGA